jgi:hypothetical protein
VKWPLSGIDGVVRLKFTGLSGGAPDCPVSHPRRTRRSREKEKGVRIKFTGLSGGAPDCPVAHRTVRCANGRQRQRSVAQSSHNTWSRQRSVGHTGLSGVHRTVSGAPTDPEDQRSTALRMERNQAPDMNSSCPVVHRIVRCTTRQNARLAFQVGLQWLLAALGL